MNNDPRGITATKFIRILTEVNLLGARGLAHLLDTASPEELAALGAAADLVLGQIDRVKRGPVVRSGG